MRRREQLGIVPHGCVRHLRGRERFLPCRGCLTTEQPLQDRHEQGPILDAQDVGGVARVNGQIGPSGCLAEALPLAVVANGQHQPVVGSGEGLIRHDLEMRQLPWRAGQRRW